MAMHPYQDGTVLLQAGVETLDLRGVGRGLMDRGCSYLGLE